MIQEYSEFLKLTLSPSDPIREAIFIMNKFGQKIVLITDKSQLVGVLTDGDLRKFLETSVELNSPVSKIMNQNPVTCHVAEGKDKADLLMRKHGIDAIPIIEKNQRIVGLFTRARTTLNCLFVIMAGGRGKRLLPYTQTLPKPLVPIAGKPIIDFILEKAATEGMSRVIVSVNHLAALIRSHCSSGIKWGLDIDYITEDQPLGTCGALSLLDNPREWPVMVTNSDVVFPESYASMLEFHFAQGADVTIAGVPRTEIGKYGELELAGNEVIGIKEKPVRDYQILGGVYCFNPKILKLLTSGSHMDMPEFLNNLILGGFKVKVWTVSSEWWDIGQEADLLSAERWIRENNYGAE